MNKQSRAVYVKRHLLAMKNLEQHAHKLVLRCYRKQKPRVLSFVVSGYSADELRDHLPQFYKDSIKPLWAATLKQVWNNAAQEAEGQVKEWIAPNDVRKAWGDDIDQYIAQHAGSKIDGIADTDRQWLANTIRQGEDEGKTPAQMAEDLQDEFDSMSAGRAGTIARTETASAYNAVGLSTAQDLMPDGATKTWNTTSDNPRPAHEDADGDTVPIGESFEVGGEDMDYPSDPNGSDWNTINCLCVLSYDYPSGAAEGGGAEEEEEE